jgi:hypothetical protein
MPDEVPEIPVVVDVPHMGVGDVTGPLGVVLAVVLGLDKFGLLRRNETTARDGLDQRDRLTRMEADVRHLHHRLTEIRSESQAQRDNTARVIETIRDDLRKELDRGR